MDLVVPYASAAHPSNASAQHAAPDIDTGTITLVQAAEQSQQVGKKTFANGGANSIAPLIKKSKTSQVVNEQTGQLASKSRRRKSLGTLLSMPLDVLFEVLGHLAPKDLINVSRTTKILRATLLDKSATTAWKASRQRLEGPHPPRNMSEHSWAILIFTTTCTSCGVNNVQAIDFLLRRRMCKKCKEQNLVVRANALNEYPGMDPAILDLIAPNFDEDSFWRPDIDRMSKILENYSARIIKGDEAAVLEMTKYKQARIRIVKEIQEDAIVSNAWIKAVACERLKLKNASMLQQKIRMATAHFHALGYLDEDMSNLTSEHEIIRSGKISEKAWKRLCERVEPMYFRNKELRREREDRIVRRSRRDMADKVYRAFAVSLPPSQWKYLPSTEVVCGLQPFRDLVTANADVPVTEESFAACVDDLLRALDAARLNMKRRHIGVAPQLFPGQDWSEASLQKAFTMLELVKNSYQCFTHAQCDQFLFGWDEISSHHCLMDKLGTQSGTSQIDSFKIGIFNDDNPRFMEEFPNWSRYNRDMMVYVAYVARVSGFPGTFATVAQMDSVDLRYTCSLCNKDSTKVIAYTWRGCAEHLNRRHADLEAKFRGLMKLNPTTRRTGDDIVTTLCQTDADWVKARERELERGPESRWACTHCPAHLTHSIQYIDVLQHVRETHEIDDPQEVVDLTSLRRVRKDYATEYEPTS